MVIALLATDDRLRVAYIFIYYPTLTQTFLQREIDAGSPLPMMLQPITKLKKNISTLRRMNHQKRISLSHQLRRN